ncbi:hypothetical protein [Roseovarius salis]|uniref:hypothetical protein n=1 Tax=Roseovarius salis TaxID=3376063 RepID=UPI0037C8299A
MNANQIINMVMRLVMRRVIGKGVNAGINAVGKRMKNGQTEDGAEGSQQVQGATKTQKRVKQSMRAARRFGRF